MKLILSLIFEQLHNIWSCRNQQTHGTDSALQDQILREHLTIRVAALYSQIPNLLSHDRSAFDSIPQEDILSQSTSDIRIWLQLAEPTIHRCLQDARTKSCSLQSDIRDFFDEASYVDSDAEDTVLSFDTLASSGTIVFTDDESNASTSSASSFSRSSSLYDSSYSRTPCSDTDTCPSP